MNNAAGATPAYSTPSASPGCTIQIRSIDVSGMSSGNAGPFRLLPLAGGIVRVHQPRPVEPGRHRCEVPAGARVAGGVLHHVPGKRARGDVERLAPARPRRTNNPFFVPTSSSVMIELPPEIDGRTWMRASADDGCVLAAAFAVHEHVDVAADRAVLVQHPALQARVPTLQLSEHLAQGVAGEVELRPARRRDP